MLTLPVVALGVWAQHVVQGTLEERGEVLVVSLGEALRSRVEAAGVGLRQDLERLCRFDRRANQLAVELRTGLTLGLTHLNVRHEPDGELLASSNPAGSSSDPPTSAMGVVDGELVARARCELASERFSLVGTRLVAL